MRREGLNLQCFKKAHMSCQADVLTEATMLQDTIPAPALAPAGKDA